MSPFLHKLMIIIIIPENEPQEKADEDTDAKTDELRFDTESSQFIVGNSMAKDTRQDRTHERRNQHAGDQNHCQRRVIRLLTLVKFNHRYVLHEKCVGQSVSP